MGVTIFSFPILLNGYFTPHFNPQSGVKQGNLLSPYLVMICVEVFSSLLIGVQESQVIHGIKIAHIALL